MKTLIFLLSLILINSTTLAETTRGRRSDDWGNGISFGSRNQDTKLLEKQIMCAYKNNGVKEGPTNQWARANYMAGVLASTLTRLKPTWSSVETAHLLAQTIAETGTLRHFSELKSRYASSRSKFKGRGAIQITHKANYAKLAGCIDQLDSPPAPAAVNRVAIAAAPRNYRDQIVRNPARAFSENTDKGKSINALTSVCWLIDNAERFPRLKKAMNCVSQSCVDKVGQAVNRGPGSLGHNRLPFAAKERRRAFQNLKGCFKFPKSAGI